jgi:hypothetical protein
MLMDKIKKISIKKKMGRNSNKKIRTKFDIKINEVKCQ